MLTENIRNLRQSFHISQVELAKELGVSKQCISNWENDNILPSIEMLIRLAKFFNVSTDFLLDLDSKNILDVSHLTSQQIAHLKLIINDLKNNK